MAIYDELTTAYPGPYATHVKPDLLWLSERCARTPEGHWWIKQGGGHWVEMRNTASAQESMTQQWCGGPHHITADDIKRFMRAGYPVVDGTMKVPTSKSPIIQFQSKTYINTWLDTLMRPDDRALTDPRLVGALTLWMRMIRESLCGKEDEKSLSEMLAIANGDDSDEAEFRFVMNWLAAPIQSPGLNLQVNLWFLGQRNGTGKGTLAEGMAIIMGGDNVKRLNAEEIERGGWTDGLEGKLLVVINELEPSGNYPWNTWIKQNTCDPVVPLRKRNTHSFDAINFANYIFTTNNESPACLDALDRRNALIATTRDAEKAKLSLQYQQWAKKYPDDVNAVLAGFVAILHRQRIDMGLLNEAPMTIIKADTQEASSRENDAIYWMRNDPTYPRDVRLKAHELVTYYRAFMKPKYDVSPKSFGSKLAQVARGGTIERRKLSNGVSDYLIPATHYPPQTEDEGLILNMKRWNRPT